MNVMPIQVIQQEVLIPLDYFADNELEVVVRDAFAVVRSKSTQPVFPAHERQAEMLQEVAAFEEQHQQLVEQYLNEYVAIHKGQVVDHDVDHLQLVRRIDRRYPDDIVLIRQVEPQLPRPLRAPSPRFTRL